MEEIERSRIEAMVDRDPELRSLWKEHLDLKSQIARLESLPHSSPTETLARRQLQKQKLAGKDRIVEILAHYRDD
jgi:uncharacterized protein YdcH (DUF465 family)